MVYPPNTKVTLKTTEFEFTAHINNLGFRGTSLSSSHQKFRVMALGDSFVYGWGVNDAEVWPVILANSLSKKGIPVEVINLGWVGKGPIDYADVAEKAIPLLKPDLVIVAILQGDDLQQLPPVELETTSFPQKTTISHFSVSDIMQSVYPNTSRLISQAKQITPDDFQRIISGEDIQHIWQDNTNRIFNEMNDDAVVRFQALTPEIQRLFYKGLLNPHLVRLAVLNPQYYLEVIDMTLPATQFRINRLTFELDRIKNTAASTNNAEVIVVAVPSGIYINQHYMKNSQQLGFNVEPEILSSDSPDEPIALAATQAGLKFFSVLNSFRQSSDILFYDLDGHFTVDGHQLFAENLVPIVEEEYQRYQLKR